MRYLHAVVRVGNLEASLDFYLGALGMKEISCKDNDKGPFTLIFLAVPGDEARARSEKAQDESLPSAEPWGSMPHTGKW